MNGLESAAFGLGQDTFDMLPRTGFMFPCEIYGYDICWPF